MAWWIWVIMGTVLAAGLDLVIQWVLVRLGPKPERYEETDCPHCGARIPRATWRCWRCRRWVRRRLSAAVLSVLQIPAFVGGVVLLLVILALAALYWLFLWAASALGRHLFRPLMQGSRRVWRALFGPLGRWRGRREAGRYWWRGGREVLRYRIPIEVGSPGSAAGEILERSIGERELSGAWRGAVVWLREPDAVIDSAFLAGTHLTEVGQTTSWVDRGTFHRRDLAPIREWVGWRGTRPDLEALGDLYLSIAGGVGLVAVGTGNDRPPRSWSDEPGEAPLAWLSMDSTHVGTGWDVELHWNLPYDPLPLPEELAVRRP